MVAHHRATVGDHIDRDRTSVEYTWGHLPVEG